MACDCLELFHKAELALWGVMAGLLSCLLDHLTRGWHPWRGLVSTGPGMLAWVWVQWLEEAATTLGSKSLRSLKGELLLKYALVLLASGSEGTFRAGFCWSFFDPPWWETPQIPYYFLAACPQGPGRSSQGLGSSRHGVRLS